MGKCARFQNKCLDVKAPSVQVWRNDTHGECARGAECFATEPKILTCVVLQCSQSCDGGIKSRMVKCVAKQPSRCNPATRPRSTILCNLQSCSSTNRWTGPRFRPRKIPTQPPRTQTTQYSTTIIPTNTSTHITTHANTSPTSDIIHEDDKDLILVRKNSSVHAQVPTITRAPEDEEGSTDLQPPDKSYTPGYDYIEDPERIREDDMFTSKPEEALVSSVQPKTMSAPVSATKPATTTTNRMQYNDHLTTHACTKTSLYEFSSTPKPTLSHLNTQSAQVTVPTVKILRKALQTLKVPNESNVLKAARQKPHMTTITDDYVNLNARDPVSRNVFWEVGNWSDVRI